jgi:hypothetical protein
LLALTWYAVSSRIVLQCRDSLQSLALSNRAQLVWVPGYCGIHGIEEADALARAASSSAFVGSEPCLPLAPSSVKRRAGVVIYITLRLMNLVDCLSSVENVAEKSQSRLDVILTEAA